MVRRGFVVAHEPLCFGVTGYYVKSVLLVSPRPAAMVVGHPIWTSQPKNTRKFFFCVLRKRHPDWGQQLNH